MATRVIISPTADADLLEILDYIAPQSPERAFSFIQEIQERASEVHVLSVHGRGEDWKG
jgi:plasmid stabilization system protein ParE